MDFFMENLTQTSPILIDKVEEFSYLLKVILIIYPVIFVVGLCGNVLIVCTVLQSERMQSSTNILFANLATSDCLMSVLTVPLTPIIFFLKSWIFGRVLCHMLPVIMASNVHVSSITATVIAIDRYRGIVHPLRPRLKQRTYVIIIVVIWVVSVLITFPVGKYARYEEIHENVYSCKEQWPNLQSEVTFTFVTLTTQFVAPLAITTYCYVFIARTLHDRSRCLADKFPATKIILEIKRERKINRMLLAIVLIFVVCWMPLNIYFIWHSYSSNGDNYKLDAYLYFATHALAMCSALYNPFLYYFMNDTFHVAFKKIFYLIFCCHRKNNNFSVERTSGMGSLTKINNALTSSI